MREFVEAVGRGAEPAVLPVRDALRRRRDRPARHPHRAGHLPVRDRQRAVSRAPTASASSGCDRTDDHQPTPGRQPGRDRPPGLPRPAAGSASRPSPSTPTPTPGCRSCARPTSPCACPGNAPAETYLRADLVIEAARRTGADAIHPGYGFLSENADFARAVHRRRAGLGRPDARVDRGDGLEGRGQEADGGRRRAGARQRWPPSTATEADLPLLVKASAGGGGRGMRDRPRAGRPARRGREGRRPRRQSAFGDGTVFVEPYVEHGRHVEVQVVGPRAAACSCSASGTARSSAGTRRCVEEAPAPGLSDAVRERAARGRPRGRRGDRLPRRRHRRVPLRRGRPTASASSR